MAEEITIDQNASKAELYTQLLPQIEALVSGETDQTANIGNIMAVLKESFDWLWVGVYLIQQDELVLGPFQGPLACTRIRMGKGVCGTTWETGQAIIVPDVEQFPGHIACSSLSRSEIVLPIFSAGKILGVLDVDSAELNQFDEEDAKYLAAICHIIANCIHEQ